MFSRLTVPVLVFMFVSSLAKPDYRDKDCDTCRTIVEQFYKGWEKVISSQAASGKYENRAGSAPKITYNQDIEDYLQGFCTSEYMKGMSASVEEGCPRIMKEHHRPLVGKFLHGEERYGATLTRTERPERIMSICRDMVGVCPSFPVPHLEVKSKSDKCSACTSTVSDALYVIRRSRLGDLKTGALLKRKLDVLDLLDSLCTDTYYRHDDFPATHNSVCSDMMEEDDEGLLAGLLEHVGDADDDAAHAHICARTFSLCSEKSLKSKAEL